MVDTEYKEIALKNIKFPLIYDPICHIIFDSASTHLVDVRCAGDLPNDIKISIGKLFVDTLNEKYGAAVVSLEEQ